MLEELEDYGVRLYRITSGEAKEGSVKLFVGGLHGDEARYTAPILEHLAEHGGICVVEAIIVPRLVENGRYIGVLTEEYYQSKEGMNLLRLIQRYKPRFYFELHAYEKSSYSRLTDPERVKKRGVPHFVDLDRGILIGSIAPILRRKFSENDFCMTIEIPKWKCASGELKEKVLEVLRIGLTKVDREEVMQEFRIRYPSQIKMAEQLFHQYYRSRCNRLKPF